MRVARICLVVGVVACGPETRAKPDAAIVVDVGPTVDVPDSAPLCPPPSATPADVKLAPPYDTLYSVYDLGPVPGVPNSLGGTAILSSDPNTLLVAGASETTTGAIYKISVSRDACGHIVGFGGTASVHATAPFVDANLLYVTPDLLLYTEWPQYGLGQLSGTATAPSRSTDLRTIGMVATGDSGAGGLGRVPPGLTAAGELRIVTWPGGRWHHVATAPDGPLLSITGVTETVTLPNNPGGFAYVPAGSPGFTNQSVIVAEWNESDATMDRVAVYEVDQTGDPTIATRKEFFSKFPRPWGAYFEPVTGDYFFLSWGTGMDRIFVVQGFVPPPPIL